MKGKRAINYARVSTPRQAELYSLDFQLEQERIYDADLGFTIVAEFKDDQSGRKMERDYLAEARRMLAADEADVLVTWKLDRLHRNYVNTVILRDEIQRMGKELHYAQLRMKSGTTAKQRLPEDVMALMAEVEADEILERTMMGRRQKAEKGRKWIGLNKPPYGYKGVGRGQTVYVVVDKEQAKIVVLIFTWYVIGDGEEGPLSTDAICKKLTAMGIPTPQDNLNPNARMKKRGYGEWSRATIYYILRQSAYSGTFYQYRYTMKNGKRVVNPNKNEWVGVPFPQIVDSELFAAAQRKLDQGREVSPRSAQAEYLVGRRIWCECGYKMRSLSSKKSHTMQNGNVHTYTYYNYACPGKREKDKTVVRSCSMPSQSVPVVDKRVWEYVKEEIANPVVLERKLREIQSGQRRELSGQTNALASLYQNKEAIEQEMKRLATLYAKKNMPDHLVDELLDVENHKLQLTENEIAKTEKEIQTPLTDETIATLVAFSEEFAEHLEAVEHSFIGRRTVVDGLDIKVTVFHKENEIWLRIKSILKPKGKEIPLFPSDFASS